MHVTIPKTPADFDALKTKDIIDLLQFCDTEYHFLDSDNRQAENYKEQLTSVLYETHLQNTKDFDLVISTINSKAPRYDLQFRSAAIRNEHIPPMELINKVHKNSLTNFLYSRLLARLDTVDEFLASTKFITTSGKAYYFCWRFKDKTRRSDTSSKIFYSEDVERLKNYVQDLEKTDIRLKLYIDNNMWIFNY